MKDLYVLTEYTIPAGLPEPLTIGLVSDLHERDAGEILALLQKGKPDLIMVAGDTFERRDGLDGRRWRERTLGRRMLRYALKIADDLFELFTGKKEHDPEHAYRFLREAGRIAPVFLSLGNHEDYLLPADRKALRESGTMLLDNADCEFRVGSVPVRIGGLSSDADLEWLADFCRKDGYKILLCHHPEYYKRYLRERGLDLVLSGHAHGGQIRIKGQGIYSPGQGLLPSYTGGLYHGTLVVTTGCCNTASIPRWGNPCEAVMIHLN